MLEKRMNSSSGNRRGAEDDDRGLGDEEEEEQADHLDSRFRFHFTELSCSVCSNTFIFKSGWH